MSTLQATIAFVGLGNMGYPMAGRLARHAGKRVLVWNRTESVAIKHAEEYKSEALVGPKAAKEVCAADVIFMCLPTTNEVRSLAETLLPHLRTGTVFVDCTSGDPDESVIVSKILADKGAHYVDAPVSGGPSGATAGTLTTMIGGPLSVLQNVKSLISCFAKKIVHVGESPGMGHALKAVNNVINATNLMVASEGLLALKKRGISPDVAVEAINGSSGRSLATQQRIPDLVLPRTFNHGFALGLMAKDVRLGKGVVEKNFPEARILPVAAEVFAAAESDLGGSVDYTEVVRFLEKQSGAELKVEKTFPTEK